MLSRDRLFKLIVLIFSIIYITYHSSNSYVIPNFEITQKNKDTDTYYITGNVGHPSQQKEITIAIKDSNKFIYKENPEKKKNVTISYIWDVLKINKDYYLIYEEKRFPWNILQGYKILELHNY